MSPHPFMRMKSVRPIIFLTLGMILGSSHLLAAKDQLPEPEQWVTVAGERLPLYTALQVKPVRTKPPVYPQRERQEGIEGVAVLVVLVDGKGKPLEINVKEYRPSEAFAKAAVECMRGWRFKKLKQDGEPIRYLMTVPVVFQISP